jgi:iron-sulfur cluster assembly protein
MMKWIEGSELQMAISRFAIITLTDAAATRIQELMATAGPAVQGLRVGVKNGGCAGMAYTVEFAEEAGPLDEIVEDKGVKLLVDPKALMFLLGTEMDFETTKVSSGFVFRNPNQVASCGCGESVTLKPVSS